MKSVYQMLEEYQSKEIDKDLFIIIGPGHSLKLYIIHLDEPKKKLVKVVKIHDAFELIKSYSKRYKIYLLLNDLGHNQCVGFSIKGIDQNRGAVALQKRQWIDFAESLKRDVVFKIHKLEVTPSVFFKTFSQSKFNQIFKLYNL